MSSARVTVLLTVWNGMPYLAEAVQSILAQTHKDFVFLILDNGSEDGTAAYLDSLNDPRLEIVHLPENIGRTAVLNKGLGMVQTPYTAVMDADDVAEPQRLEMQTAFLEAHPEVALVGSDVRYIDQAGAFIGEDKFPPDHAGLRDKLPLHNQFAHAACAYRTEAARAADGYPAKFPYAQDFALWLALLRDGHKVANIQNFLARIRVHPGQATRDLRLLLTRRADNHRLAELMLSAPGLAPASRQAAFFRSAGALWGLGHKLEALRALWRGIKTAPLHLLLNPILWQRLVLQRKRKISPMQP